jgi:cardiolipin synthase
LLTQLEPVGNGKARGWCKRERRLEWKEMVLFLTLLTATAAFAVDPDCRHESVSPLPQLGEVLAPVLEGTPVSVAEAHPWVVGLIQHKEACPTSWDQLSCAHRADKFETLETPESGFEAKAEMLLGQKLPQDFIKNQDPYAPLDFSKAPKLKGVYVSTLVFRADFYGTVMARLLKYQAEHGALVNVTTTGYMMLKKDRALLEPIAEQNPNFRLDEFKYENPGGAISKASNLVTDKFRDMHVKLFITLSDEKESDNAVIFGGRNIHDGFLFKQVPDHSKFPALVQYGKGKDDDFVHWNDFEAKVTSKDMATATAAQLQHFLSRDIATAKMHPFTENAAAPEVQGETFRHFISEPYNDGHALEKQYVSFIDSAGKSIKISSPYLRPTPEILGALKRASARGVNVEIQTRVELLGDTQAWLYEEVNKESINSLYKDAKIYKWKEDSILHSKFILVDGEKAMIGSSNLSRRSFVQDVENGFVIQSEPVVADMDKVFQSYVDHSEQITKPLPRKILPSAVIKVLENQF